MKPWFINVLPLINMGNRSQTQSFEEEVEGNGSQPLLPVSYTPSLNFTPTLTLKTSVHISPDSLSVISSTYNQVSMTFRFDSECDCTVTFYYFASETLKPNQATESYYVDTRRYPQPVSYNFPAGLGQSFPAENLFFDLDKFSLDELTFENSANYPLIIEIRPQNSTNLIENTYVKFQESGSSLCPKVIRQKLTHQDKCYLLKEIYGTSVNPSDEDEIAECVVCMTNPKNTLVLPCTHMCLCVECANIMRSHHNSRCPICRTNVQSLVNVLLSE